MIMATLTSNASKSNSSDVGPKIDILKEKPPLPYNPWWIITSFLITVTLSLFIYISIDYNWLEVITRNTSLWLLQKTGLPASIATGPFPMNTGNWTQFGEAAVNTPGISIAGVPYNAFWIVKACTGMQAGAILISLIYVTPIPMKGKLLNPDLYINELSFKERFRLNHPILYSFTHKTIVAAIFFVVLFITNSVRIWFHLYLVGEFNIPFTIAHDDLSKPIGFIGTLFFAWIIEKSGIPIIDTFADWMDASWLGVKALYHKVRS